MEDTKAKVADVLNRLSEEERRAFLKIARIEKNKIYLKRVDGSILEEIETVIREEIK